MAPGGDRPRCVVLLRNLGAGMLHDIVVGALGRLPDVVVHEGRPPDGTDADLVIERDDQLGTDLTSTVVVSESGRALLALPVDQLSESVVALVVNSVRRRDRDWIDAVLVVCRRIDAIVQHATAVAETTYDAGGGFADWRAAFADGGRIASEAQQGEPLASAMASPSVDAETLLRELADTASVEPEPRTHDALEQLVEIYRLDGRELDTMLLCFVHELDPRYGRRFAYLQQDSSATAPTVDLVAALLAATPMDRLDLQRALSTGPLVTNGLVRLTRPRADAPLRSASLALDPSVMRILCGDTTPRRDQDLVDTADAARSSDEYVLTASAKAAIGALAAGDAIHLGGADPANRRAIAIDLAASRGRRLLATTFSRLADDEHRGEPVLARRVEEFRRELIRLGAFGFVDGVPDDDQWQTALADAGSWIVSGGQHDARPLLVAGAAGRRNVRVVPPRGVERTAIWSAATEVTGVSVSDGIGPLASRFGVPVDRAVAALLAADREHPGRVSSVDVMSVLTSSDADAAGGLLTTAHPRVRLDDLVVDAATRRELDYACARIRHRDEVVLDQGWDQRSSRLTGTYLLFAGPSGTGKTMAAEAIAHELGLPIQYLELSSLLSRWVGEFEQAVDKVFAAAEASGGIIAMNEADALLAPRTDVDTAQARYANAGTSHLLSRLEQFRGHVIFTSNLLGADSIDPAFHRRLTATIRFRLPDSSQRLALWRTVWPDRTSSGNPVRYSIEGEPVGRSGRLEGLAAEHALSGGSIANIARNAAFLATQRRNGSQAPVETGPRLLDIDADSLDEALRLELGKIGDFRLLMSTKAAS